MQVDLSEAPVHIGEVDAVVELRVERVGEMVVPFRLVPEPQLAQDIGQAAVGVGPAENIRAGAEDPSRLRVGAPGFGEESPDARDAPQPEEGVGLAFPVAAAAEGGERLPEVPVRAHDVSGEAARAARGPEEEADRGVVST